MHHSPARRRLAIAMRAAVFAAFAVTLLYAPTASATTPSDAEAMVVGWINHDRIDRGLAPVRRADRRAAG